MPSALRPRTLRSFLRSRPCHRPQPSSHRAHTCDRKSRQACRRMSRRGSPCTPRRRCSARLGCSRSMRTDPRRRRRSGWMPSGTGPGRLCAQAVVQVVSQQVAVRSSRTQAGGLCTAAKASEKRREKGGGSGLSRDAAAEQAVHRPQRVRRRVTAAQQRSHGQPPPSSSSRGQGQTDQEAVQSSRAVEHSAGQSVGTVAGGFGCGQFSVVSRPKAWTPHSSAAGGAACGADAGASHWPE